MRKKDIDELIRNTGVERILPYKAYDSSDMRKIFWRWHKGLRFQARWAFRRYRLGNFIPGMKNVNEYIYNHDEKKMQKIIDTISDTLNFSMIDKNVAAYRKLSKIEYEDLSKKEYDEIYVYNEFKGTHISKEIKCGLFMPAAYAIYLIPKGCKCAYINYWGWLFSCENELLINRNVRYEKIKSKEIFERECFFVQIYNMSANAFAEYLVQYHNIDSFFAFENDYKCSIEGYSDEDLKFSVVSEKSNTIYTCDLEFRDYNGRNAIHIVQLQRACNDYKAHTGSKLLEGIVNIADYFKFEYIAVNPQAYSVYGLDNTLDQTELEEWYMRHLSINENIKYKKINCVNEIYTL